MCFTPKHACLMMPVPHESSRHRSNTRVLNMCLCVRVAVVVAHGGDELLHAMLGAAVAGGPRLVHQRGVLLAWPHAHAGGPPAAFYPHTCDNLPRGGCCYMQQNLLRHVASFTLTKTEVSSEAIEQYTLFLLITCLYLKRCSRCQRWVQPLQKGTSGNVML